MNLDEIRSGAAVFIDANVLIYAVERRSRQCRELLERCDRDDVRAFSSTIVLTEVCHRRMLNEAKEARLVSGNNPARLLAEKHGAIQQLGVYADNVRDLLDSTISFEPIQPQDFYLALELQKQHELMTNDGLNLAVLKRLGLKQIATADKSFATALGIIVYRPADVAMA
jgi:predicted nucleic acid-binding protein